MLSKLTSSVARAQIAASKAQCSIDLLSRFDFYAKLTNHAEIIFMVVLILEKQY